MNTHYRHYNVIINGNPLNTCKIEAISDSHITKMKIYNTQKLIKYNVIKDSDKVEYKFIFCTCD